MSNPNCIFFKIYRCILPLTFLLLILSISTTYAVPPAPEIIEQLKQSGELEAYIASMVEARAKGVDRPAPKITADKVQGQAFRYNPDVVDTFNVLVILADFTDNTAAGGGYSASKADFENLLFSNNPYDNTYSMTEFYIENSYGSFFLKGTVAGWYRMPQTYAYYVDGQKGFGSYPQNAQRFAEDAITAADPDVDFSLFDSDGNGWCDGVFIVHAGPGYESTGNVNQIHSHAWGTSYTMNMDGIYVSSYTTEPEESGSGGFTTMGVYAHEYGHFIGLPDLYDTDYSSSGIGSWSLMAGGSWNYGGAFPAFMDAWCKKEVGFLNMSLVTSNMIDVEIPSSYHNPVIFKLWKDGINGLQYFLIENRYKGGNDKGIPSSGLIIYHIDENMWGNSNDWHRLVTLEQADGLFELENGSSSGNSGDVWPYAGLNHFDDLTIPNSRDYSNQKTKTAVWNISEIDSVMYANFDINYSRPKFNLQSYNFSDALFGNNNGLAENGETITFEFTLNNSWLAGTNVTGTLSADNLSISFDIPSVNVGTISGEGGTGGNSASVNPIQFTIPADFAACIDSFFLEVTSDNTVQVDTFRLALNIGVPQILVVDDDNGGSYQEFITEELYNFSLPFQVWDKSVSGSPTGTDLNAYETVIWIIGNARDNILSSGDISALQSFMDNGGNLFLTGQSIAGQLNSSDPAFLNNYLKAQYVQTTFYPAHNGQAGSPIGDGLKLIFISSHNQTQMQTMSVINGSISNFQIPSGGVTALSYSGSYKLFLMSFGFEAVSSSATNYSTRSELFGKIMDFFNSEVPSLNPVITNVDLDNEVSLQNVVDHTPTFAWSLSDTTFNSILQHEVKVGTGSLCNNSDNYWYPPVFNGSDTSVVYNGLPLVDGMDYVFQVRVFNGETWSNWNKQEFHMNIKPETGAPISPVSNEFVTSNTPPLGLGNGTDDDGDVLTYEYEVYSDAALTNLVTSASGISQGGGLSTYWTVNTPLTEDQQYYWRGRVFDGYENSDFSVAASFWVNAANQPPLSFDLISPLSGTVVEDETPEFLWHSTTDNDPNDQVLYSLWVSEDAGFSAYNDYNMLNDTSFILPYSLEMDLTIYWKVKAIDLNNGETWSTSIYSFLTPSSGCCQNIRGNANNDPLDEITISDLTFFVDFMFASGSAPVCPEEANFNGDALEDLGISDITYLVEYLFNGGPAPGVCP